MVDDSNQAAKQAPAAEQEFYEFVQPQLHPLRLRTLAHLYDIKARPLENATILEIGCGVGSNVLPIADTYPNCQIIAIDSNEDAIAKAQYKAQRLNLKNVHFEVCKPENYKNTELKFDYIICANTYSWISPKARHQLVDNLSTLLSPSGVCTINYNTFPGCNQMRAVRDLMLFHSRNGRSATERISLARSLRSFLTAAWRTQRGPYFELLKDELGMLQDAPDSSLTQDFLNEYNQPMYFFEFYQQINRKNLQYIGEIDFSNMTDHGIAKRAMETLDKKIEDVIEREQYRDFLRNTRHRSSLICHRELKQVERFREIAVTNCYFSSTLRSSDKLANLSEKAMTFADPVKGLQLTCTNPKVCAALMVLQQSAPGSIAFNDLLSESLKLLQATPSINKYINPNAEKLTRVLLAYASNHYIDMTIEPRRVATKVPKYPRISVLNRYQTVNDGLVVNQFHIGVKLSQLERFFLPLLDGEHDLKALSILAIKAVESGQLTLSSRRIRDAKDKQERHLAIASYVKNYLRMLCKEGFLCEDDSASSTA